MNKTLFFILQLLPVLCLIYMTGCKPSENKETAVAPTTDFYPITQYIISELNQLDSIPLAIIKYSTRASTTDTSIISKPEFRKIANSLISADVSLPDRSDQFEETSFLDATLGTLSLTYRPIKNASVTINQLDVLLNQTNSKVLSVYAETREGDSLKKMLWTPNRSFQVTTLTTTHNGTEQVLQERYVWNDLPVDETE